MRYCIRCILPDTRPGLTIDDEGVCSACRGHEDKEFHIDWPARKRAFEALVADAKDRSSGYDCIVPVSGGKDSWYQIIKAQEYGLNVLAVTWRTPARTEIGQQNLDNMISRLGVDHIDYTINPDVERRFMKTAFEKVGATGLPMHMALFVIPIRFALKLRIPLIIWGENAQLEYGGGKDERLATDLDREWLAKHGCLQSTNAADWVGEEDLTEADLAAYSLGDTGEAAAEFKLESVFLGSFFKWNSFENARIASEHGFESNAGHLKTGTWEFADIDCRFISLHHFLKWYKFGITRSFDNLSVQIRMGMTTREEAIEIIRQKGWEAPHDDIKAFCAFQGLPEEWFWQVCESFRNPAIWHRESDIWKIRGFLIEDWAWLNSQPTCASPS
ncbi:N-acetyl sugar amidotransferase [Hwanghaeella grinnelliae]|uniref:N-acetyl sugar amidotransferase n=1 Tax=Hwanghaeella grinnelliae TaxID=2500179 RepID=A0A3S3UR04_9PROT|nr:N-acetyl sugar amidotransferase [Hwanghaeella grinnelliae]RVU38547.1 N-acetyl sugar amidotransferase [Hwanghaeella grinnelliae]